MFSDVYAVASRNVNVQSWLDIDRPWSRVAVAAGTFHEPLMRERLYVQPGCWWWSPPATA